MNAQPQPSSQRPLSRREAAAYAGVSLSTIKRAMASGSLRYGGGGGSKVFIRPEWIDEWIERRRDEDV